MRMSQSTNMFIKVTLLICFTVLLLQCSEGSNTKKLRAIVENRLRSCKQAERFKKVVSTCKGFVNNTVQAGDPLLQKCCSKVGSSAFGQDCLCLMREIGRVNPSDKKTQQVLEAVSSNKLLTSTCAALSGIDDCSAVVKALNDGNKILKTTIKDDFDMMSNCDIAALNLMDVCKTTVSKARNGGINSKEVQTTVCCHELERFGDSGCLCKLGSSIPTSKDVVDFLADIRAALGTLAGGCPSYAIEVANSCPSKGNQADKTSTSPLLFDKCETAAQETIKTCTPMINDAIASFKKRESIYKSNTETITCCEKQNVPRLEAELHPTCFCNTTIYKMFTTIESKSDKNSIDDMQTKTCCKQLRELIAAEPRSCFCNITHHKTVTTRATTTELLKSMSLDHVVRENCGIQYSTLSNFRCMLPRPSVSSEVGNSYLGALGRLIRGENTGKSTSRKEIEEEYERFRKRRG